MTLQETFKGNPETGQIGFFQRRKDLTALSREEKNTLMQFFGIEKPPVGLKWEYLKASKELVCEMDLYKEGWELAPQSILGINGEEGAGKTQLLYDLAVLYGIPFENVKTGGQTLRLAGERLRKRGFFRKKGKEITNQAAFIERTDEDDKALDDMQFGWVESPSLQPKAVDSRLIGLAIHSTRKNNPNVEAASFYIIAAETARMKRLSERTGKPIEVVKAETEERRILDIERYTRLYKGTKRFSTFGDIINPHSSKYYDYIIDNTHYDRAMALKEMHAYLLKRGLVLRTKPYDREKDKDLDLPAKKTVFTQPLESYEKEA